MPRQKKSILILVFPTPPNNVFSCLPQISEPYNSLQHSRCSWLFLFPTQDSSHPALPASPLPYLAGFFSILLSLLGNGHCFCYSLLPRIYSFPLFSVSKFSLVFSAWLKGLLGPFSLLQQFLKRALVLRSKSLHFLVVEMPLTLIESSLTSIYSHPEPSLVCYWTWAPWGSAHVCLGDLRALFSGRLVTLDTFIDWMTYFVVCLKQSSWLDSQYIFVVLWHPQIKSPSTLLLDSPNFSKEGLLEMILQGRRKKKKTISNEKQPGREGYPEAVYRHVCFFKSQQSHPCASKALWPGNKTRASPQDWTGLRQGHRRKEEVENRTLPRSPWRRSEWPTEGTMTFLLVL